VEKLQVEVNAEFVKGDDTIFVGGGVVLVTPPLDEAYWHFRVRLSDRQAIVAFPKFGVVGIGFQYEENWNTNLPSDCDAQEIFAHIKHNKADDSIPDATCIEAILLLQETISGEGRPG
jgi:hypothetical protein